MKIIETGDGSSTLLSERYDETFHSTNGAVTESRHVFLDACGVSERLRAGRPTRVLEIGFGLGLNALITADTARQHGAALTFHSLEHDVGMLKLAQQLNYDRFLESPALGATLRRALSGESSKTGKTAVCMGEDVNIVIHWQQAVHCIATFDTHERFDAVYLDAFSPDTNPECWSEAFFRSLHPLMTRSGRLSTYSAKGTVRRALQAAGFTVNKLAGPPGKREMLIAHPKISALSQSAGNGTKTSPKC